MKPRLIGALAVFAALVLPACTGAPPAAEPVVGARPTTAGPIPSGRPADTAAQFDRDPCSVATGDELGVALSPLFKNVTGANLRHDGKPTTVDAGCDFAFVADGTDSSEVFHFVRLMLRRPGDGAGQLSQCRANAKQPPHGPVAGAGDEACLRPQSVLVLRNGSLHFTLAVSAQPPRSSRADEETELAPLLARAAATLSPRLPRQ